MSKKGEKYHYRKGKVVYQETIRVKNIKPYLNQLKR
jgi:hypothetical protein